jgi:hypothetical protein
MKTWRLAGFCALAALSSTTSAHTKVDAYIRAKPLTVVVPKDQTQGTTTLDWDGGSDNEQAQVWLKVDNGKESKFSGESQGTEPATIKVGKKYTFSLYNQKRFIGTVKNPLSKLLASVEANALQQTQGAPSGTPLDDLAGRGEALANQDPLSRELRNRQASDAARRGFDIGMAAAEGHTAPGPGKQKIHDSLSAPQRSGFNTAVTFSLERNRNADYAAKGAAIAQAVPLIAKARAVDQDVFYWLGFDIATGIFGNPALGARGNTAIGPGSLKIRDSLSAAAQRGFNAAVKVHLGKDITPPPGKFDPGSAYEKVATPKNSSSVGEIIAALAKEPFISKVQVVPHSRNVVLSFSSTQSTVPLIEIGKVAPKPDRYGVMAFGFNSGAFSRFIGEGKNGRYVLNLDVQQEEQLEIGTTYFYIINVFNNSKNDAKRPREQVSGQFTTLPQTVKVVWERVLVEDDSDDLSTAEIQWWFWANYGQSGQKISRYDNNDMDSGKTYGINKTATIEYAPDHLSLAASGVDTDVTFTGAINANEPPLSGPKNGATGDDGNVGTGEFDLSKYPGTNVSIPFRLNSMPGGNLKFVIFGRLEITRPTP